MNIKKDCYTCESRMYIVHGDQDDTMCKNPGIDGFDKTIGSAHIGQAREKCPHHKWGTWISPADIKAYRSARGG